MTIFDFGSNLGMMIVVINSGLYHLGMEFRSAYLGVLLGFAVIIAWGDWGCH